MITGIESLIAKNAATAALKAVSPTRQFINRRRLEREFNKGESAEAINQFFGELNPSVASRLVSFIESSEFSNVALGLATDYWLGICGKKTVRAAAEIKQQLRRLIALNADLPEEQLDPATEVIFGSLSSAVSGYTSSTVTPSEGLPASSRAALVKVQASYLSYLTRNSELLRDVVSLADYADFEQQLRTQVGNLYGSMRLPHAGTTRQVAYEKLYVQPNLDIIEDESAKASVPHAEITVEDLMSTSLRAVLLGDPGGGKSTLSLKLAFDTASVTENSGATVPFLVVLREYAVELASRNTSIVEYLETICRVPLGLEPPPNVLEYFLLNGRALVIFDGLDELLDTSLRRKVVDAVTGFTYRYPTTPILVTSRRVGYPDAPLDPELFKTASLREFDDAQVQKYVRNWFNLDDSITQPRKSHLTQAFMGDSAFVEDLRVNPLMLSLMCGIYSSENYIPRNRPDVYEKCALLLFDRWDKQRGINAPLSFDAHVQAAMRSLALWLYPQQAAQQGLSRTRLISYMTEYLRTKRFDNEEEAENAATEFIDFCKGRAWVLTEVGSDLYGFTHRTFLEYFAASQLVRLNSAAVRLFEALEGHLIRGGWEVVAQLALQILNKTVEDGADDFLELVVARATALADISAKGKLFAFAAQALTYIVPRPPVLQAITTAVTAFYCDTVRNSRAKSRAAVYLLLGASSENLPLIAKYVYDYLVQRLDERPGDEGALAVALYPSAYAGDGGRPESEYGAVSAGRPSFWREQAKTERSRIEAKALPFMRRVRWIAMYCMERDLLSAEEALGKFGLDLIVDMNGPAELLPLVNRIVLSIGGDEGSSLIYGTEMRTQQIDNLRIMLMHYFDRWPMDVRKHRISRMRGIVDHVLFAAGANKVDAENISSLLFFCMILYSFGDEASVRADYILREGKEEQVGALGLVMAQLFIGSKIAEDRPVTPVTKDDLTAIGVDEDTARFIILARYSRSNR